jgi:hypothetical protein
MPNDVRTYLFDIEQPLRLLAQFVAGTSMTT